ncbi:hypothetical protein Ahy_B08g093375 [Arachis hypogaea]|uniref:DDE-1 domain-containing protein n=1 Tax=Arachis hypogaea TaxID=3818 RepID=A0A444Y646_ARAHY|nr:hypothetical protein Ahy_B08g093375 [Arachis hypogaea]
MFHVFSLYWSLIIICIPDKGDESGPIKLHLDSLSLHSSRSLFDNIKSLYYARFFAVEHTGARLFLRKCGEYLFALYEALMRQEELPTYIDNQEEARLRKKKFC